MPKQQVDNVEKEYTADEIRKMTFCCSRKNGKTNMFINFLKRTGVLK